MRERGEMEKETKREKEVEKERQRGGEGERERKRKREKRSERERERENGFWKCARFVLTFHLCCIILQKVNVLMIPCCHTESEGRFPNAKLKYIKPKYNCKIYR